MSRYDGKPFLRLLDSYVLKAIGCLDPQQEAGLVAMEPKLAEVYGSTGGWDAIVAGQMDFPEGLSTQILQIWEAGKRKAAELGVVPDPNEFTRQFVDANFPN